MMRRRPRRPQLRTRVLAGVLAVTLVALVAFDVAARGRRPPLPLPSAAPRSAGSTRLTRHWTPGNGRA